MHIYVGYRPQQGWQVPTGQNGKHNNGLRDRGSSLAVITISPEHSNY